MESYPMEVTIKKCDKIVPFIMHIYILASHSLKVEHVQYPNFVHFGVKTSLIKHILPTGAWWVLGLVKPGSSGFHQKKPWFSKCTKSGTRWVPSKSAKTWISWMNILFKHWLLLSFLWTERCKVSICNLLQYIIRFMVHQPIWPWQIQNHAQANGSNN